MMLFKQLREVLEKAVYLYSEKPDARKANKPGIIAYHKMLIPVDFGDDKTLVRITLQQDDKGRVFYDSNIESIKIEKPADVQFGSAQPVKEFQNTDIHAGFYKSIIRLLNDNYNKFSDYKIQYMTAWHGSPHDHDRFDSSYRRTGEGIRGVKYLDRSSRNRPLKDIKKAFLAELPENADFDELMDLVGTGKFTAEQDAVLNGLNDNDWLGFDYPAQAISAALGNDLNRFDVSLELRDAVAELSKDLTHNYVIFNDADVEITAKFALASSSNSTLQAETVQTFVDSLPISGHVKVWQSPADLKAGDPNAYNQIEKVGVAPGRVQAMIYNGTIHVIAGNIPDMQRVKALVVGHEMAHAGQSEKIVDMAVDWFRRTTGKTGEHIDNSHAILKQVAREYGYDLTNDKQYRRAVQEATARIAEQAALEGWKPRGLMARLYMYIKHWLRQLGWLSHVSDSELNLAVAEMLRIGEKRLSVGMNNAVDKNNDSAIIDNRGQENGIQNNTESGSGSSDEGSTGASGAVGRSLRAIQAIKGLRNTTEYYKEEAAALKQFASENGLLRDRKVFSQAYSIQTAAKGHISGAEHHVVIDKINGIVIKRAEFNDMPMYEYLERILDHNRIFPDVAYTLEGFSEVPYNGDIIVPAITVTQPYVEARRKPDTIGPDGKVVRGKIIPTTFAELKAHMATLGFVPNNETTDPREMRFITWKHSNGDAVTDLAPENAITDIDGNIRVIDPQITRGRNVKIDYSLADEGNGDAQFALAPEIKESIDQISESAILDNLKNIIPPADHARFTERAANKLEDIKDAVANAVANDLVSDFVHEHSVLPLFIAEEHPDFRPVYETEKERDEIRMDMAIRMSGNLFDKEGNLTTWEKTKDFLFNMDTGKETAWGKLLRETNLSRLERVMFDEMVFEADVMGAEYSSLADALRNPRIKKLGLTQRVFDFYKKAMDLQELARKVHIQLIVELMHKAGIPLEKIAATLVRNHVETEDISSETLKSELTEFMQQMESDGKSINEIARHVSDYRGMVLKRKGRVHRDHGEGNRVVDVYHHITSLDFDADVVNHETDESRRARDKNPELEKQTVMVDRLRLPGWNFPGNDAWVQPPALASFQYYRRLPP